jgi:hypothetical protein
MTQHCPINEQTTKITLEAGTTDRSNRVWIGGPAEIYDTVSSPLTKREIHVLHFSIEQAEAVCQMLRAEIRRVKCRRRKELNDAKRN